MFNNTILTFNFPDKLKVADVSPIFEKDDPQKLKNYRPVSVLPVVSKVFERLLICMLKNICHHICVVNSVSIHHKNIRLLSIELYKVKHNLSNQVMSGLFNLRNINYDFRSQTDFELVPIYITDYGARSLRYFAPKIWNIVPIDIRNSNSLSEFTTKIKSWKPVTCPCNLCRTFVGQVGYID